jgi:hypothetical protein
MVDYHREWRQGKGREKFAAKNRETKARYPERERARNAVASAIRKGTLVRGACYRAGKGCEGKVEAHHDDYSRPLEVVWTCRKHHRVLDRARRMRRAA